MPGSVGISTTQPAGGETSYFLPSGQCGRSCRYPKTKHFRDMLRCERVGSLRKSTWSFESSSSRHVHCTQITEPTTIESTTLSRCPAHASCCLCCLLTCCLIGRIPRCHIFHCAPGWVGQFWRLAGWSGCLGHSYKSRRSLMIEQSQC